jgi:hypothetical protein
MMQDVHGKLNLVFHGKSSILQEEGCFHQQIALKVKEVTSEVLNLGQGFL